MRRGSWVLALALATGGLACAERKSDADRASAPSPASSSAPGSPPPIPGPGAAPSSLATGEAPAPTAGDIDPLKDLEQRKAELERLSEEAERKQMQASGGPDKGRSNKPGSTKCTPGDPLCSDETPARDGKKKAPMIASTKSLTDRLTDAQIQEVVSANIDKFAPCTKNDAFLTIRASITPDGKVIEPSSETSIPDDPKMRDCVIRALGEVAFPTAGGIRPSPITFDLMLKPRSD